MEKHVRTTPKNNDLRKNASKYSDPTAYKAIVTADREHEAARLHHSKTIGAILRICELAGYYVDCNIVLVDKKTGKRWD